MTYAFTNYATGFDKSENVAKNHATDNCIQKSGAACLVSHSSCDRSVPTRTSTPPVPKVLPNTQRSSAYEDLQVLWYFIIAAVIGLGYLFYFKWARGSSAAPAPTSIVQEPVPDPPQMPPPAEGQPSVGIRQHGEFVYIWLRFTEADLHRLRHLLDQPVDEYPRDLEAERQETARHHAGLMSVYRKAGLSDAEIREHQRQDEAEAKRIFASPHYITLRDMLQNPFRYRPIGYNETHADYLERLRKKVFPKIKSMVEFAGQPKDEGFTL